MRLMHWSNSVMWSHLETACICLFSWQRSSSDTLPQHQRNAVNWASGGLSIRLCDNHGNTDYSSQRWQQTLARLLAVQCTLPFEVMPQINFLTTSLRYKLHPIQFAHGKYTSQWPFKCRVAWSPPEPSVRTFPSSAKGRPTHLQCPAPTPSPRLPRIYCLSLWVYFSRHSI